MILRSATGTIVRTACPTCGLVDVGIDHVTVLVTSGGSSRSYAYDCPRCSVRVEVRAGSAVSGMLYDIGARLALSSASASTSLREVLDHERQIRAFEALLARTDDIAGAIERSA